MDNDEEKYKSKVEQINSENNGSKAQTTKFRTMENYFSYSLIEQYFNVSFTEDEKENWKDKNMIHLISNKRDKLIEKDIKNKIHKELTLKITKDTLKEIEAWDEVVGWFKTIKQMYNEG